MDFNFEAALWYILAADCAFANVVAWFYPQWYQQSYPSISKLFPATKPCCGLFSFDTMVNCLKKIDFALVEFNGSVFYLISLGCLRLTVLGIAVYKTSVMSFLKLVPFFLFGFTLLLSVSGKKPNILFILTDDQAPHTLSVYGNKVCQTPHLDKLAASGIVLDQAYHMGSMSGAVCSPSRTMIMSGVLLGIYRPVERST